MITDDFLKGQLEGSIYIEDATIDNIYSKRNELNKKKDLGTITKMELGMLNSLSSFLAPTADGEDLEPEESWHEKREYLYERECVCF